MAISSYYRGRLSFKDVLDLPIDYYHTLEYLMFKHKDEDQKSIKEAEALEDEIQNIT